ncbi:MAG: hypothetical protein NZ742_02120 [Acidobacteria bacterium]|nr:hypothetical protein [Acidobacteriota bacterium]MDW7983435.1 hypothetical protein [Acidobacteriota bacterium]
MEFPGRIAVTCTGCSRRLRIPWKPEQAGVRLVCPVCHHVLVVRRPEVEPRVRFQEVVYYMRPKTATVRTFLCYMGTADLGIAQRLTPPLVQEMGADVEIFTDGLWLWEAVRRNPPDLIVVEAWLPRLMGYEVIERVRRDGTLRDLPVILLASVTYPGRYRRPPVQLHGADEYIEPDVPIPHFQEVVQRLLRRPPASESQTTVRDEEEARRLARLLLTDFVLYHMDRVRAALASGDLRSALGREIAEFHAYYRRRVDPQIWERHDYFEQLLGEIEQAGQVQNFLTDPLGPGES